MTIHNIADALPGTIRIFKPKNTILYQGEIPRSGYYVKKGIIKTYTLQANGDEQIVAFYGRGDFFPLPWLFGKVSTAMYYHETTELTEVISVTRDDINQIIRKDAELTAQLLEKMVNDQASYLMRITALEQSRAVDKILFTLYYLLYQFGEQKTDHTYRLSLQLTHATIASLVGLTRETTATELNKLKKKGLLTYAKKYYTVNKTQLEKALGEDSFSELVS